MERGAWHLLNQHGTGPPGGLVLQRSVVVIARNDNHVCDGGNRAAAWSAASMLADPDLQVFQNEIILESRRRPELARPVAALYETYVDALEDGLKAFGMGGDVRVIARTLFAALDGLVLQYLAAEAPRHESPPSDRSGAQRQQ